LKGGLDDTFLKGGLKGVPDIILGFKKGKMLNMDEMLPVLNYSEKMKYKNPNPNFLLKGSHKGVCVGLMKCFLFQWYIKAKI
jgi:hypothetical protein